MNFSEWQQIASDAGVGTVESAQKQQDNDHQQCWQLITDQGRYFVKTRVKRDAPWLRTQAYSLKAIAQTETLRCPLVIAQGQTHKTAWLVLEWLSLKQTGDQVRLEQQLAALHQHTAAQFGWQETNFIGQCIQHNHQLTDWTSFYRSQRLLPQLRRAAEQGLATKSVAHIDQLLDTLETYLSDHQPKPSLLHGNFCTEHIAFLEDATPVVFSPSCYYGDLEMDWAAAELSGLTISGFDADSVADSSATERYQKRKEVYQLYYLLVAFNQNKPGYASMIQQQLSNLQKIINA
jgi:fructosamine-3-kinase